MTTIWIIFVVIVCACSLIYTMGNYVKHNAKLAKFTQEHPEAAKVQIKANKVGIIVETLQVHSVNGEEPLIFQEMLINNGFYLLPGKNVLEVSYEWTRPGVIYKTVTKYIDPTKIEVEVEPNKTYKLSYSRKTRTVCF